MINSWESILDKYDRRILIKPPHDLHLRPHPRAQHLVVVDLQFTHAHAIHYLWVHAHVVTHWGRRETRDQSQPAEVHTSCSHVISATVGREGGDPPTYTEHLLPLPREAERNTKWAINHWIVTVHLSTLLARVAWPLHLHHGCMAFAMGWCVFLSVYVRDWTCTWPSMWVTLPTHGLCFGSFKSCWR